MWLNVLILSFACLLVGFILGWIVACPRRWDAYVDREPREATLPQLDLQSGSGGR